MSVAIARLYNFANDSAAQTPISSAKVDAELNAIIASLNKKVQIKSTAPSNPVDGQTWVDLSVNPPVLKIYDQTNAGWAAVTLPAFAAYTEKTSIVDDDVLLINDSEASNAPKSAKVSTLSSAMTTDILGKIFPVGSFYTNKIDNTNPADLLGFGTWVAVEGYVIAGYKSGDANFGTAGATVGVATVTLTKAQSGIPDATVNMTARTYHGNSAAGNSGWCGDDAGDGNKTVPVTISGQDASTAHTNIQPTLVAYVWERIA